MTITRVQGAGAVSAAASATRTYTFASTATSGNLLISWHVNDLNEAITKPTGWTEGSLLSNSGGTVISAKFAYKISDGTETAAAWTDTTSSAHNTSGGYAEYSTTNGWGTPTVWQSGEAEAQDQATFTTPTVDPTDGIEALVLGMFGVDNENNFTGGAVNGSTTGVSEVWDIDNANFTGVSSTLLELLVASTASGNYSASDNPGDASGTNSVGVSQIAIFEAVAAAGGGTTGQLFGGRHLSGGGILAGKLAG